MDVLFSSVPVLLLLPWHPGDENLVLGVVVLVLPPVFAVPLLVWQSSANLDVSKIVGREGWSDYHGITLLMEDGQDRKYK